MNYRILVAFLLGLFAYQSASAQLEGFLQSSDVLPDPQTHGESQLYGWAMDSDGNTLVIGAFQDESNLINEGAIYIYELNGTTWELAAKIVGPDEADDFGQDVALQGETIVVGANRSEVSLNSSGAAYIYEKPATGWEDNQAPSARLSRATALVPERLGFSVDIDNNVVVLGAPYYDEGGAINIGRAYVYEMPDGGWEDMSVPTAEFRYSAEAEFHFFGENVVIDGDAIAVGIPWEGPDNARTGAVAIFEKSGDSWTSGTEDHLLAASDGGTNQEYFGAKIAIEADRMVVGAWGDADNGNRSGSLYIFEKSAGSSWTSATEVAKLLKDGDGTNEDLGSAEILLVNGNVYAGASGGADNNGRVGVAYVFEQPEGGWTGTVNPTATLSPASGNEFDLFGQGLALVGDQLIVSAPEGDDAAEDIGSAYVFTRPSTGWADASVAATLLPTTFDDTFVTFGSAVAMAGGFAVVGAPGFDNGGFRDSGGAWLYQKQPSGEWTRIGELAPGQWSSGLRFGFSVAMSENLILVAAQSDEGGVVRAGTVFVYEKPAGDWVSAGPTAKLDYSTPTLIGNFGFAMDISETEDVLVIGGWQSEGGFGNNGAAYVYEKPGANWTDMAGETAKLTNSTPHSGQRVAWSVGISGDVIVLGNSRDDRFVDGGGTVAVYEKPGANWTDMTETHILFVTGLEQQDNLGRGASIDGDVITASAPAATAPGGRGRLFVWRKPALGWASTNTFDAELQFSDLSFGDIMGARLALDGDRIGLSVSGYDLPGTGNVGAVVVWQQPNDGWTGTIDQAASITMLDPQFNASFGEAFAMDGDDLLVGARTFDTNGEDNGKAYFYTIGPEQNPVLTGQNPAPGAVDVVHPLVITLEFDEIVQKGAGIFRIEAQDDASVGLGVSTGSGGIQVEDNTVRWTISENFNLGTERTWILTMTEGSVVDLLGNPWEGVSGISWTFTSGDTEAPVRTGVTPEDGTVDLDPGAALSYEITFSEDIQVGSGSLFFENTGDNADVVDTDAGDAQVSVSGSTLSIAIGGNLLNENTEYVVYADEGFVQDLAGNDWQGLSQAESITLSFGADLTPPAAVAFSPSPNATGVDTETAQTFVITFDSPVSIGLGSISFTNIDDTGDVISTGVSSGDLVADGSQLNIAVPAGRLASGTTYFVLADGGLVADGAGNDWVGISADDEWRFSTAEVVSAVELHGVDMRLVPNPTSGTTTLLLGSLLQGTVKVFDLQGRQVLAKPITAQDLELNLSYWPAGIYVVVVTSEQETATQRLLVR